MNEVGQKVAAGLAPAQPGVALHRARRPDGERLRHAGRLHLRHPRDPRAPELRGAAGRRAGPRDRPRHPPPHRGAASRSSSSTGWGWASASIASKTVRRYGDLAQQGLALLFLKYSRDDERAGRRAGGRATPPAPATIRARSPPPTRCSAPRRPAPAQRLPGFLSTHPDPGDRVRHAPRRWRSRRSRARRTSSSTGASTCSAWTASLFGEDPRQGYFAGDVLLSTRRCASRWRFPAGWKHQDSRAAVASQEPGRAAVMQLSLANAGDARPRRPSRSSW